MTAPKPDLPMSVSLTRLPLLSLRESVNHTETKDSLEYIPTQDIFIPDFSHRTLTGTISGGCEPFPLRLRGVHTVNQHYITICHAPMDDITLPINAANPPTWLAITNYDGREDNQSICFIPSEGRPLMTFTDIYCIGIKDDPPLDYTQQEHLDNLITHGFHMLVVDFTRSRPPGTHTFTSAAQLWQSKASHNINPLEIFKLAA